MRSAIWMEEKVVESGNGEEEVKIKVLREAPTWGSFLKSVSSNAV